MIIKKEIEEKIIEATRKHLKYLAADEHARDFKLYSNPFSIDFFFIIFKIEKIKKLDDYTVNEIILSFYKDGLNFETPSCVKNNYRFFNAMQLIKRYSHL